MRGASVGTFVAGVVVGFAAVAFGFVAIVAAVLSVGSFLARFSTGGTVSLPAGPVLLAALAVTSAVFALGLMLLPFLAYLRR